MADYFDEYGMVETTPKLFNKWSFEDIEIKDVSLQVRGGNRGRS